MTRKRWWWFYALCLALACGVESDEEAAKRVLDARAAAALTAAPIVSAQSTDAANDADDDARALRAAVIHAQQRDASAAYAFSRDGAEARAENPAQGLRVAIEEGVVRLEAEDGEAGLDLRLGSVGRQGDRARARPAGEAVVEANRVRFTRGSLEEWYLDGPLGLEQGFDLSERPAGTGRLELAIETAAAFAPALERDMVVWRDEDGRARLYYGELFVRDALGRVLEASLGLEGASIVLSINDKGARYPLAIDPLIWTQQQKLTASDGATEDNFGISVSVSGDTAVVGAYVDDIGGSTNQGSAYVFVRSAGVWTEQQKLVASDGAASDYFGISVSVSGDTAVVGAYADDVGANTNQGSAYVFVRSAGVWTEQQKLVASDGAPSDFFGYSVSVSGDTAVVGAYSDNFGANANQGSAHVFVRSAGVWSQQKMFTASDGAADDFFGRSVSVSGDTAVVGSYWDDVGANANQGSAHVFVRSAGVWSQQKKFTASDGAAGDKFGISVSVSGNTAVVGAYADDIGGTTNQGSAYVFVRSAGLWTEQQKLIASDGAASDQFGVSVSVSGDTAVVGAYADDVGANTAQGSAYVFVRSAGLWTQEQKLVASDGASADYFGFSVSVSGDTAVVGSYLDDVGANANQGSAYVFVRSAGVWTQQQKLVASNGAASDVFGYSVSVSGDTAVVGANADEFNANMDPGSAYVFGLPKTNGTGCSAGSECVSDFCVDGVCCNNGCGEGVSTDCQACNVAGMLGACSPVPMGATCRAATDVCDLGEACNGTAKTCPADAVKAAATTCRAASDICDAVEACNGTAKACPADAVKAAATTCRAATDVCDLGEACNGTAKTCPADAVKAAATECRAATDVCDLGESCNGTAKACPADAVKAAATTCRASAGGCDPQENCDGTSKPCPADALLPKSAAGSPSCAPYLCDGAIALCPASCGIDGDCSAQNWCNVGACAPQEILSKSCVGGNECLSGSCVDDVCCESACGETCKACNVAESEGTCTLIAKGLDPGDECASGACDGAGNCKLEQGQLCTSAEACLSGSCVDGVCCESACSETCKACNVAGSEGTCTLIDKGLDFGDECASGACDGAGNCKLEQGKACASAEACLSSFCADGVCCESACAGGEEDCQACSQAKGGSEIGICSPIVKGFECRAAAGSCDATESCDGASTVCPPDGARAKGDTCDDGDACTGSDACLEGSCVGQDICGQGGADKGSSGCSCRVAGASERGARAGWLGLLGLGLFGLRRRKGSRARSGL